jgi:RimJ/RimL family protein N-acetyltransferase
MMITPPLIPTLETERLTLRPFIKEDLGPFVVMVANPQVIGYATYSGQTMNRSQAFNWICMMLGHWHLRGFGIWAVEEKASGQFIGRIGLQYLDWFDDVELVWMLDRPAWGKGYGTEGARAAVDYGFEVLRMPTLTAIINLDNEPSRKLAERLGMFQDRELEREGVSFVEYRLNNPMD